MRSASVTSQAIRMMLRRAVLGCSAAIVVVLMMSPAWGEVAIANEDAQSTIEPAEIDAEAPAEQIEPTGIPDAPIEAPEAPRDDDVEPALETPLPADDAAETPLAEPTTEPEHTPPAEPTTESSTVPTPPAFPTHEPAELPAPTAEPEPDPSPTPTPEPLLRYAQPTAACDPAEDQPSSVAHGSSVDYVCHLAMDLVGTDVAPDTIRGIWDVHVSASDRWSVSLLPPVSSAEGEAPVWTPEGAGEAGFSFSQEDVAGTGTDPVDIDVTASITFRLRLQRPVCSAESPTVLIHHDAHVAVTMPGIIVETPPGDVPPTQVTPGLELIPAPAVTLEGPIRFGEIGVSSAGVERVVTTGTATLTVSGLDASCGRWLLLLRASDLTSETGRVLPGSRLSVISINNEFIPGGACELTGECAIAAFDAGPNAASSIPIVLGLELRMTEPPSPGVFDASLTARIAPANGE